MNTQKAFSTDFIIDELQESFSSLPEKRKKFYSKMIDAFLSNRLQLYIEERAHKKIEKLNNSKDENELKEFVYKSIVSLIARSSLNFSQTPDKISKCLDGITMQTHYKKRFSIADKDNISSVFHENLQTTLTQKEQEIGQCLKKALINQNDISNGTVNFLFETKELPKIEKGDEIRWYDYLSPYGLHTNRVYIRDPYFYSKNIKVKLHNLIGPLLTSSYQLPIKVEIIADLAALNVPKEEANNEIIKWVKKHDDRINISCYDQRGSASSLFHDRYLFTDYWVIKIPSGLDIVKDDKATKDTIPTLVGRYSPDGSSWDYVAENWDEWKNKKCNPIN